MGVDVTVAASASVHGVVLGLYRKYVQQTPATKLYCDVALAIQRHCASGTITSQVVSSLMHHPSSAHQQTKSGQSFRGFPISVSGRLLRKIIFCKIMLGV